MIILEGDGCWSPPGGSLTGADPAMVSGLLQRDFYNITGKFTKCERVEVMINRVTTVTRVDSSKSLGLQRVVFVHKYYESES